MYLETENEKINLDSGVIEEMRYELAEYMENSGFADAFNREVKDMPVSKLVKLYEEYIGEIKAD